MEKTALFLDKRIRTVWDNKNRKWMFSIIDIIAVLTGTSNPRRYWSDLKRTIKNSAGKGNLNINATGICALRKVIQFKLTAADGKKRLTDVASGAVLLQIIKLIPSQKAKPLKDWLKSAGRNVSLLPEPILSLTEQKPVNRLLRVCSTEELFLILSVLEKTPEEKSVENEIEYIKTAPRKIFFPACPFFPKDFLFPWSVRLSKKDSAVVQAINVTFMVNMLNNYVLNDKHG